MNSSIWGVWRGRRRRQACGCARAPFLTGQLDLMLGMVSNSNPVSLANASASSPFSMNLNDATTSNGQPAFAQIVRDALNKTTSNAGTGPTPSSKVSDTVPTVTPSSASAPIAPPPKPPGVSKPSNKSQAAPSKIDSANPHRSLTAPRYAPLLLSVQGDPTTGTLPVGVDPEDPSVNPASSSDSQTSPLQTPTGRTQAISFALPLQEQLSALFASPAGSIHDVASPAEPPNSAAEKTLDSTQTPSALSTPANGIVAAASRAAAQATTIAASTVPFGPGSPASAAAISPRTLEDSTVGPSAPTSTTTATTASTASPQKPRGDALVSRPSSNPQQGQELASVLQQVEALQANASSDSTMSTANGALPRTAVQVDVAQAAVKTALTASSLPQALAATATAASTDARGTPSDSGVTRPVAPAQNAAATTNNHSAAQDSSSNPGGQNSSDSSTPSDSSATSLPTPKSDPSEVSATASGVLAPKADASQITQVGAPTTPAIAVPLQPSETAQRPAQEALPSVPAQAQTPSSALQTPDAPLGHLVNAAQLTNVAGLSEMRIAMQTDKLGAIELHARVSGDEVGASIFVEKRDAHAALAVELPALQQALSDKQLRIDQVALTQGSLSSTAGDAGANAQQNQRGMAQPQQTASFWNETRRLTTAAWFVPEQIGIFNANGRLSVQA
jgi:Flagellar hook-length control protein FliK